MTVLSRSKKAASTATEHKEALVLAGATPIRSSKPFPRGLELARKDAAISAVDGGMVIADCGVMVAGGFAAPRGSAPSPVALALGGNADLSLLVIRPCYLALRRALNAPVEATGVVLVGEPQRALQQADV